MPATSISPSAPRRRRRLSFRKLAAWLVSRATSPKTDLWLVITFAVVHALLWTRILIDLKAAQDEVLKQLGPRMVAAIAQYAKDHGYSVVFDTSSSEMARLYAPNATDITKDVPAAYEKQKALRPR